MQPKINSWDIADLRAYLAGYDDYEAWYTNEPTATGIGPLYREQTPNEHSEHQRMFQLGWARAQSLDAKQRANNAT